MRTAISPRLATSTRANGGIPVFSPSMPLADQLTIARAASVALVVVLFEWDFENHLYWATAVFVAAMATDQVDGWLARREGQTSALGSMLDPVADKVLVLAMLIMVVGQARFRPGWWR